jgi:hypothetical protein
MKKPFLLRPSLMLTALALLAALLYRLIYDWLTTFAKEFYGSTQHVLYPFLAARVVGYRWFLWMAAGALAVWCAALWVDSHVKRSEAASRRFPAYFPLIVEGVVFLAMATMAVFFSDREWVRFGRPCWDNYCVYAGLIFEWLRHPSSDTWTELHSFMQSDYHCNSPLVPLLVACTKLLSGLEITASYRALCGGATVLGFSTLFWFVRRKLAVSADNAATIILLLASNIAVIRASCFPQTDAFVFLWTTLAITQSLSFMETPTRSRAIICFAVFTLGLFVKLSFLPALAIIPLWTGLERAAFNKEPARAALLGAARRALVFAVGPLLIYLSFQLSLGLISMYAREFGRMQTDDKFFPFHLISLAQTGAVLLPLIAIGARRLTKADLCLLAWSGLYILSLWIGRTSGWDRFYLPIIPPLAIVSRHGVMRLKEELSAITVWVGIFLYAVMNYGALLLNLYQ